MTSIRRTIASAAVCAGLLTSSVAGASAPIAPATATQPGNAWLTLSMLTPSGAAELGGAAAVPSGALCGAAATTAAQPTGCVFPQVGPVAAVPPPPPGPVPVAMAGPGFPPIPVLAILLGVLLADIIIASSNHHHNLPNSPA